MHKLSSEAEEHHYNSVLVPYESCSCLLICFHLDKYSSLLWIFSRFYAVLTKKGRATLEVFLSSCISFSQRGNKWCGERFLGQPSRQ